MLAMTRLGIVPTTAVVEHDLEETQRTGGRQERGKRGKDVGRKGGGKMEERKEDWREINKEEMMQLRSE